MLAELHLGHGPIKVLGTPRRLVVLIEELSPRQPDREELVKGPPAHRAFGPTGEPTKAAEGFARSKGLNISDLEVREMDGGEYTVALVQEKGHSAIEVLAKNLPALIGSIRFERSMRWNQSNISFSRPIRWLVALFGEHLVPFEYAECYSGRQTRGLRFNAMPEMEIKDWQDYFSKLNAQGIIVDQKARKTEISSQLEKLASKVSARIPADPELLTEVTNLVEAPVAILGSFEEEFLDLPREVLISVMKKHQRYFPLEKDNKLLPYFITVANGSLEHKDVIAWGNEAVVRARFADAAYFIRQDRQIPLEGYLPRLDTLTFQKDLGSMLDKTKRITALAAGLADQLKLDGEEKNIAVRAAELCKADLVTQMVVEMTSLQGVLGRYYALDSGEPEEVATAIEEHYLPTFTGSKPARSEPGLAVGLADRLDSLAGLFAVGLAPTGNKDPFAQRRAALGLVESLITWDIDFDLHVALNTAGDLLPVEASEDSMQTCFEFILERARNLLLDQGYRYDVIDSVLATQGYNPARAARAVKELNSWVQRGDWEIILPAYSRCVRITRDQSEIFSVDDKHFTEDAEKDLFTALEKAEAADRTPGSVNDFFNAFVPMIPAIDKFFEDVLVMVEDEDRRNNRLGLLQRIVALADTVADLSRLEGF
jgi:glycyl-tRNA synthetase